MTKRLAALAAAAALTFGAANAQATNVLLIEDQGGFGNAATVLTGDGHTVTVVNNEYANGYANLLNSSFVNSFQMIVWGERGGGTGDVAPAGVLTVLENYIQAGGHLLVTGYDTLGSPTDTGLAALVRSTTAADQVSGVAQWQTANIDNFILNGLYGDFRDLAFTAANGYDDDVLDADESEGAVALATTPGQSDRIIYTDLAGTGGSVGYWNGGLSGDDTNAQPDFSDGGNPQNIFRNWVAGVSGDVVAVPEPGTLALFGTALAGLALARRRKR